MRVLTHLDPKPLLTIPRRLPLQGLLCGASWGYMPSSRLAQGATLQGTFPSVTGLHRGCTETIHLAQAKRNWIHLCPTAPSMYIMIPMLGLKVYEYDLLWAIWNPLATCGVGAPGRPSFFKLHMPQGSTYPCTKYDGQS